MAPRCYVGHKTGARVVFQHDAIPTPSSHPQFAAVVGPFKTKRAALWAASGAAVSNPHYAHVNDAERIAKGI